MQTLTYKGVVYPWQCDQMGHMNVMWYTAKFDEGTWNLFAELGITRAYLQDRHLGMAAVQQNTSYKQELLAGDVVEVRSEILEVREKVVRFRHEMRKVDNGELVASTELTAVHMDSQTRKSCAIGNDIRAAAVKRLRP